MASDAEIRFERQSEQSPGMTPGDVIFKLKAQAHGRFRRERDDLHHEMHLSLREALLGFTRSVKHLDGRDVAITHKGITQPFEVRKVRARRARTGRRLARAPPRASPTATAPRPHAALPPSRARAPRADGQRGHAAARLPVAARRAARQVYRRPAQVADGRAGGRHRQGLRRVSAGGGRKGVFIFVRARGHALSTHRLAGAVLRYLKSSGYSLLTPSIIAVRDFAPVTTILPETKTRITTLGSSMR